MCTWSHYHFQWHLIHKAREHPWCQVVICTEEYTSKTCGSCGYIHKKLGGSKEFCCPQCKINLDRDINGAVIFSYDILQKRKKSQLRLARKPIPLQDLLLPNLTLHNVGFC